MADRQMFGEVVNPSIHVGKKKWYTVPLSILTHTVALAMLVVAPLLATDMIPTPNSVMAFVATPPPPPPPPPPPTPPPVKVPPTTTPVVVANPNAAPVEQPREVRPEPPPGSFKPTDGPVVIPDNPVLRVVMAAPPPPPAPKDPIRPGGYIKEPVKIYDKKPIYPQIAMTAKVQGIVIIEAILGLDGRVESARVLRSQPLLDQAALDAVKQWRYTPTLLNGSPVPIVITVTVNFTLQ